MTLYPTPKINIGLNVISKRPDGFHNLETVFYPYKGVSDILEVEKASSFSIDIENCDWDPFTDLCASAWRLLQQRYGIGPVRIHLVKRIPVGAGLGGGSSDAAFTIKALDSLFGLHLSVDQMAALASELGSDCAFFIYDQPCFATGRGEILTPISLDLSDYEIRVEMPSGEHVSTKEAYGGLSPRPMAAAVTASCITLDAENCSLYCSNGMQYNTAPLLSAIQLPVNQWQGRVVNDFEASVFPVHPAIAALKERFLADGAAYASMTGSGAAVFGVFKN